MKTLALLSLLSFVAAPTSSTRSSATIKRGKTAVTAATNRGKTRVSIRSGGRSTAITVRGPAKCSAERLSSMMAREVADNATAFPALSMRDVALRLGSSWGDTARFEGGLGTILATGKHRSGAIELPGFSVKIGKPPGVGATTHPGGGRGGSTTVTGLPGGGFEVVHRSTRGGVEDTTTITMNADGSSVVERVLGVGSGDGRVVLTSRLGFDDDGNQTEGTTDVAAKKGPNWTGKTGGLATGGVGGGGGGRQSTQQPPSQPSDQSSGGDESSSRQEETPSGGGDSGGNNENEESPNPPTMTSDGTFTAPGLSIETELVASMVNWNRLGAAITTPNPMGDDRGDVGKHEGGLGTNVGGPCAHLDDPGFDPNPKFLRPNKQGWVSDPRPALRDR